ncbi:MAG: four helix bundle protein [Deltaproteobacteria bacterium]|nr:four helix bundle protein [Deltaproteobacteria bacterium]
MPPTTNRPRFLAYDRALEGVRLTREFLARVKAGNRSLGDQLVRAASSVVLNLAEGSQRRGADRAHFYRIAAGSAAEVRGVLDAAAAFGFVEADEIAGASDRFDQVVAMLRPLTR